MTIPSWPAELPRPERNDLRMSIGDNRTWSQAKTGTPRVKRGWSQSANGVAHTLFCSRAERARFERFVAEETAERAAAFLIPDYGTDGLALLTDDGTPLLTDEGAPLLLAETWLCLFGQGEFQYSLSGNVWRIGFNLLVLP